METGPLVGAAATFVAVTVGTALHERHDVVTTKTGQGRGGTTAHRITDGGRAADRRHLAALRALTSLD